MERVGFVLKVALLPFAFVAAAVAVTYGSFGIVFSPKFEKLYGVLLIAVGVTLFTVSTWLALGRPKYWFAPGENSDFDPRR